MNPTWLLVANRSRARLFEMPADTGDPVEVADFVHPQGRAHDRDLITDGPGRFYGKGEREQGHSAAQDVDVKQAEAQRFAEQIRDFLEQARTHQRFDKLWIMASPAFLGVLRDKLTKGVEREIELDVDKDVTTGTPREIAAAARREHARRARRSAD